MGGEHLGDFSLPGSLGNHAKGHGRKLKPFSGPPCSFRFGAGCFLSGVSGSGWEDGRGPGGDGVRVSWTRVSDAASSRAKGRHASNRWRLRVQPRIQGGGDCEARRSRIRARAGSQTRAVRFCGGSVHSTLVEAGLVIGLDRCGSSAARTWTLADGPLPHSARSAHAPVMSRGHSRARLVHRVGGREGRGQGMDVDPCPRPVLLPCAIIGHGHHRPGGRSNKTSVFLGRRRARSISAPGGWGGGAI